MAPRAARPEGLVLYFKGSMFEWVGLVWGTLHASTSASTSQKAAVHCLLSLSAAKDVDGAQLSMSSYTPFQNPQRPPCVCKTLQESGKKPYLLQNMAAKEAGFYH